MRYRQWVCLLIGLTWFTAGCGTGPKTYWVQGSVTFDGRPIEIGEIIFVPLDKDLGPDAGSIKNGTFAFAVKAGKKRVEIRASRAVPGQRTSMGPVYEDYIPARYNSRSELPPVDVIPGGKNQWDFPLTSKP